MQFTEAFKKLGYKLDAHRTDWSAANEQGVCVTIWRKEMGADGERLWHDSRIHADPIEQWNHKPGHSKRIKHLKKAVAEYDGLVDVVIVQGEPGVSYESAAPWEPDQRGHRWRVTFFDEAIGHWVVETEPVEAGGAK